MRLDHPEVTRAERRALALDWFAGLVACMVIVGVTAIGIGCERLANAQDDAGLLLARTCVSERGWRVDSDDCSAIYAVALRRVQVHGGDVADALRALSPRLHGDGSIGRPWLRGLERDGRRPRGWRGASWERHRPLWLDTIDQADALLRGDSLHRCVEMPSAWGSRADVRAALARDRSLRWVDVDCGRTMNRMGRYERRGT